MDEWEGAEVAVESPNLCYQCVILPLCQWFCGTHNVAHKTPIPIPNSNPIDSWFCIFHFILIQFSYSMLFCVSINGRPLLMSYIRKYIKFYAFIYAVQYSEYSAHKLYIPGRDGKFSSFFIIITPKNITQHASSMKMEKTKWFRTRAHFSNRSHFRAV